MNKETLTVETDEEGTIRYRNAEGDLHNPDGPAIVYANSHKEYWINGKLHNPDGPAITRADGNKEYWINGKRHNPHGPAITWANGSKAHYINGQLHNANGPAVVWDGDKLYWINGKELNEAEFKTWQAQQTAPLHNKIATIDGIEYTLTAK
jgi:hypothetical protein